MLDLFPTNRVTAILTHTEETMRKKRQRRGRPLLAPCGWRWTRHAVQRVAQRWPWADRPALEAALERAVVVKRRGKRCELMAFLPGDELAIFVVAGDVVVTGYPADGRS
jgi:hypothetical protein